MSLLNLPHKHYRPHAGYIPILTVGHKMLSKLPLPWGDLGPHVIHAFFVPPESVIRTPNSTSVSSGIVLCLAVVTDRHID